MHIVVLGAGIVGATTAYYLVRQGHEVTVLDPQPAPALVCSFANAGLINGYTAVPWSAPGVPATVLREFWRADAPYRVHLRPDPAMAVWIARFFLSCTATRTRAITTTLRRLSSYSFDALRDLATTEAIQYDSQANGLIYLYRDRAKLDAAADVARAGSDPRAYPKRVSLAEAEAREPAIRRSRVRFAGALLYDQDETGDTRLFSAGVVRAAARLGARFRFGVGASRLAVEGARVRGAVVEDEVLAADAVVIAAGVDSVRLLRPFGLRTGIYPVKGYSVTLNVRDVEAMPRHAVHDAQRKVGMTPLGTRLRAAGTAELAGYDRRLDRRRADTLLAAMRDVLPRATAEPNAVDYWTGLRPMTPDCLPVLGPTEIAGLWLNVGHGSLGWTLACGSGRAIADMISGRPSGIDLRGLTLR